MNQKNVFEKAAHSILKMTIFLQNDAVRKGLLVILVATICSNSHAQTTGSFKGKVIEQSTKQPIIGCNVVLDSTRFGAATDTAGVFSISGIPYGRYSVTVSSI